MDVKLTNVTIGCRSYGARRVFCVLSYKDFAPTELGMRTALSRANIRDLASSARFRLSLRPLRPLREAFVFSDFYLRARLNLVCPNLILF